MKMSIVYKSAKGKGGLSMKLGTYQAEEVAEIGVVDVEAGRLSTLPRRPSAPTLTLPLSGPCCPSSTRTKQAWTRRARSWRAAARRRSVDRSCRRQLLAPLPEKFDGRSPSTDPVPRRGSGRHARRFAGPGSSASSQGAAWTGKGKRRRQRASHWAKASNRSAALRRRRSCQFPSA